MVLLNKSLIAIALFSITSLSSSSFAHNTVKSLPTAEEGSLKLIMQELLKDTKQLTQAMLTEDFALMAETAGRIADHPKPSLATRKKLMKAMGAEMGKFKVHDNVVHGSAVTIVEKAQQKDLQAVSANFNKMISGCTSCHAAYKVRVSGLLK
jgi:cytochrome c556